MSITKFNPETLDATLNVGYSEVGYNKIVTGDEELTGILSQLRTLNQDSRASFTYHAYGKPRNQWTQRDIEHILHWCTLYNQALAIWENSESAIQIFCIKDPDIGHENVGMQLYEHMQGHYESYGIAHWTEWVKYGIEIDTSILPVLSLSENGLVLASLDGQLVLIS